MSETASGFKAITPSDSATFEKCDAVYVGGAGTLVALSDSGATCSFTAIAGGVLPIKTTKILATGTTATAIVALYQ